MMQLEGFTVTEACRASSVSRAGFYRREEEHEPLQADVQPDSPPASSPAKSVLPAPA